MTKANRHGFKATFAFLKDGLAYRARCYDARAVREFSEAIRRDPDDALAVVRDRRDDAGDGRAMAVARELLRVVVDEITRQRDPPGADIVGPSSDAMIGKAAFESDRLAAWFGR